LEQRLEENVVLRHEYHGHILEYIKKQQVEIFPSEEGTVDEFYQPHHAVKTDKEGKPNEGLFLTDPLRRTTYRL